MIACVLVLALAVGAQAAPPDPVESVPVTPVESAASAPVLLSAPVAENAPRVEIGDPLVLCKAMLLDGDELASDDPSQRDARLDVAEKCFRERATAARDAKDDAAAARSVAMADVVAAWRVSPLPPLADDTVAKKPVNDKLSIASLVESGRAEALLHGTAAGATGGFLLSGAWFSTSRQSEQETLPWLVAAPAAGAVIGAAGAWALVEVTQPTTGDVAFASSTMWLGAAQGVMLELAVFDGSSEVSSIPLRFVTVFGGGAVGLATGVALSPFLDVTQGDAAVANSAALWGGVMSTFALSYIGAGGGGALSVPQTMLLLSAGSTVPYIGAIAAHPYLTIERWPSWLIEAGGAGGFLVAGAVVTVIGSQSGLNGQTAIALLGAGTLAGVVTGAGAAWAVSTQIPSGTVVTAPKVAFAPTLFPSRSDVRRAASERGVLPGFVVGGRF